MNLPKMSVAETCEVMLKFPQNSGINHDIFAPQQRTSSSIHPNNGSMLWSAHTHTHISPREAKTHVEAWLMTPKFVPSSSISLCVVPMSLCHRSFLFVDSISTRPSMFHFTLMCFRVLRLASEASSVVVGLPRLLPRIVREDYGWKECRLPWLGLSSFIT